MQLPSYQRYSLYMSWVATILFIFIPITQLATTANAVLLSSMLIFMTLTGQLVNHNMNWVRDYFNEQVQQIGALVSLFIFAVAWSIVLSVFQWQYIGLLLSLPLMVQILSFRQTCRALMVVAFAMGSLVAFFVYSIEATFIVSMLVAVGVSVMLANVIRLLKRQQYKDNQTIAELEKDLFNLNEQLKSHQSERLLTEHQLSIARDQAEGASVAKTEFLATMSHEIRTPMNGILPILELLEMTKLTHEQKGFVGTALSSSRHLLRIINDILDYSRAESGKLELEQVNLPIRDVVDAVVGLMTRSAERKGLTINTIIQNDVPVLVQGDPIRIRQILINLVGNAIKFTKTGGISLEIIKQKSGKKKVDLLFVVRDTGIGMTSEIRERLFQSFSQADASTTRIHGGSGLGLAICKRLVELMGGTIGVKSQLGVGSLFWFQVPLRKSSTDLPPTRSNLSGARILLVSSMPDTQRHISQLLKRWGVMHETADTALDAISKLTYSAHLGESWQYELVVFDQKSLGVTLTHFLHELKGKIELEGISLLVLPTEQDKQKLMDVDDNIVVLEEYYKDDDIRRGLYRLLDVVENDQDTIWRAGEDDTTSLIGIDIEEPVKISKTSNVPYTDMQLLNTGEFIGNALLVEDNPVNLEVAKRMLEQQGLKVDVATDGKIAVEKSLYYSYDIILMDCQMPTMDGYEATHQIRDREYKKGVSHIPIVAMTANAMSGDRKKCIDAGMDDYMSKPVEKGMLLRMLRKWIPHRNEEHTQLLDTAVDQVMAEKPKECDSPKQDLCTLNNTVLEELKALMGAGFEQILDSYIQSAGQLLSDCLSGAQHDDFKKVKLAAHSLKSSSANIGGMRQSELCKQLECVSLNENKAEMLELIPQIKAEHNSLIAQLNAIKTRFP